MWFFYNIQYNQWNIRLIEVVRFGFNGQAYEEQESRVDIL